MNSTNICYLCEKAVANYLRGAGLSSVSNFYEGIYQPNPDADEEDTKDYPMVIVSCQRATMPQDLGYVWQCEVNVAVISNADDTSASQHHARVTQVFDSLITDTVKSDLSSALDGFTALHVVPESQAWAIEERSWVSTYTMQVHAAGANIPE